MKDAKTTIKFITFVTIIVNHLKRSKNLFLGLLDGCDILISSSYLQLWCKSLVFSSSEHAIVKSQGEPTKFPDVMTSLLFFISIHSLRFPKEYHFLYTEMQDYKKLRYKITHLFHPMHVSVSCFIHIKEDRCMN